LRAKPRLFFLLLLLLSVPVAHQIVSLPSQLRLVVGEEQQLSIRQPLAIFLLVADPIAGAPERTGWQQVSKVTPLRKGRTKLEVRLFGLIPVRQINVEVVPQLRVHVGGQAVGILISSHGVLVARIMPVETQEGREYPAKEAGILPGDIILAIDNQPIYQVEQVGKMVAQAGKGGRRARLDLERGGERLIRFLEPAISKQGQYLMGLEVEDPAAGVGTFTFFDAATGRYGALGHVITSTSSGGVFQISSGRIVPASIAAVEAGKRGKPGEKIGTFTTGSNTGLGTIDNNSQLGIYGRLFRAPNHAFYRNSFPVAMVHQVREGAAELLTVLDDEKVERFDVEVVKVERQRKPAVKGLVIKVTDPELLKRAGGIVQGMSGSPLIQDGKFIGAVTHVFVNDPTQGYGVLAEWMIQEAGLFSREELSQAS
jgi:stage IV sporulation protein B